MTREDDAQPFSAGVHVEPRMNAGSFYRRAVAPRSLLPVYWLMKLLALPVFLWGVAARRRPRATELIIQAGARGWDGIFFQETLSSAQEFVGAD